MGLTIIVSLVYHVAILDAFGIAVAIVLIVYYSNSRECMTFPGSYWPGTELLLVSLNFCQIPKLLNCHDN